MLSPDVAQKTKGHPEDEIKEAIESSEDYAQIIETNEEANMYQKGTASPSEKYQDQSQYSSPLFEQKMSPKLKSQSSLEPNTLKINPFRIQVENTEGKKVQKHRIVILGNKNVGKTCLFLRYMYFDKSKSIQIKQTPGRDGHIFTKRVVGRMNVHEYEVWDFLGQDEIDE